MLNRDAWQVLRNESKDADPDLTPKVFETFEVDEMSEIYSGCVRSNNTIDSV